MKKRTAILISGRGSNMQALIAAAEAPDYPAEIALVFSNVADAAGLDYAKAHGIPTAALSHKDYPTREAFDEAVDAVLRAAKIELVCLAGFMRLLSAPFARKWEGRMLNIHPSLLPAFKGAHAHELALAAGVRISGCTVHFVAPEMDAGAIVAQAAVPVKIGDTPDSLAARILTFEHQIYPQALSLLASGQVQLENGRARFG
jgi:phosphoribosylglycinamide formyltransferase 1